MYKIAVYAICKNEEQFVERWFASMREADEIFVLDTGSTDNTVKKLKGLGVNVNQEIIIPWRFDVARNKSLELIPKDYDICVCTDLDEIFEPGWRKKLENIWDEGGSFIDDNTLSVHISRLREKIGPEHIVTVRGIGYRWEDGK